MRLTGFFKTLRADTRGTSAVEYGLILGLIVLLVFAALAGVARETLKMWSYVGDETAKASQAN